MITSRWRVLMLAIVSFSMVVILTIVVGSVFRKQFKENHITSCLVMFVAMTKSTLVGIVVALWIPDMVISTILAMLLSLMLISMMTYKLPLKIFMEGLGSLFMGAMMGAMLSLMTTNYSILSILFFSALYMTSIIMAVGLWNKEENPSFFKAIPSKVVVTTTFAVILLGASTVADLFSTSTDNKEERIEHHQHH